MRFFLFCLILMSVSACNTIEGMGRDIEALGNGTSRTAQETKQKM